MVHGIYSVYDAKAKAFIAPFFLPNNALAVRAFAGCARDLTHQFFRYPEDFTLYRLGTFEDSNGSIELLPEHEHLGLAISFQHPGGLA